MANLFESVQPGIFNTPGIHYPELGASVEPNHHFISGLVLEKSRADRLSATHSMIRIGSLSLKSWKVIARS